MYIAIYVCICLFVYLYICLSVYVYTLVKALIKPQRHKNARRARPCDFPVTVDVKFAGGSRSPDLEVSSNQYYGLHEELFQRMFLV